MQHIKLVKPINPKEKVQFDKLKTWLDLTLKNI